MTAPDAPTPAFVRLGHILDKGLFAETPPAGFAELLPQTDDDWMALFASAQQNRALAPLSNIFAAKPAFASLLEQDELQALREWHQALRFRSEEIRSQVREIDRELHGDGHRFLLLKGSTRLFDDLYPDISCRYSVDLDLMVQNPDSFYTLMKNDRTILGGEAYNQKAILAGDLSSALGPAFHHLPPLYRLNDQASIELHTRPFETKFSHLANFDLWADAQPVDGLQAGLVPSVPHQIIIAVVHTMLQSLAKQSFTINIRDLFEGHRLWLLASPDDRKTVEEHFKACGHGRDVAMWHFLRHRVFGTAKCDAPHERRFDRFFDRLIQTQTDPDAWFKYRRAASIRNLLFVELWDRQRLIGRLRHFASNSFWDRYRRAKDHGKSRRD